MPTTGHTLALHAGLRAKSSKLKASSNQFSIGPGFEEQFLPSFFQPKFSDWNIKSAKPLCSDESRHHYRAGSSRVNLRCLRFEHFLALHSDAATAAGAARRLHEGDFLEPLSSRCGLVPNRRR